MRARRGGGGGGLAQGLSISLFAFGGTFWLFATAQFDPLWAPMRFGCNNGARRWNVVFDCCKVGCPGDGVLPLLLPTCMQMSKKKCFSIALRHTLVVLEMH